MLLCLRNIIFVKHNNMIMKFLNREKEQQRLINALSAVKPKLIIIYGRRRCGKSSLIKKILKPGDIYFMAQMSDEAVQRIHLAKTIGEKINGFDKVVYPDWESLFLNLNNVIKEPLTLCVDEFPYLVKASSILPSLIQKIIDTIGERKFHLILCGSSQQMMQGLVLDSSAPLYGRADEIMKIAPLEAGWLSDMLECTPAQAVNEFSVWGGVPRYWELRAREKSFREAVINIILDRYGVLHEEPSRLFMDDMRESILAFSILTIVGSGSNRLSEIAGRLNKPSTQLSRPIENLIQLGYLKREIPFGEPIKNSKKGIYRIADQFMNFYFNFLAPNLSRLELGLTDHVYKDFESRMSAYVSFEWENLCRRSIPMRPVNGIYFDNAFRWWGPNLKNEYMELDILAVSLDGTSLLIGECKWSKIKDSVSLIKKLEQKAGLLPFTKGKKIIPMLFVKDLSETIHSSNVFLPSDVLARLR